MFTSPDGTRAFGLFRPSTIASAPATRALVVVLHGCAQDASDIARGTRMNEWAAREGFVVLYPEQPVSANAQRCWNWFIPAQTTRGQGEAALLAAMIDSVARREAITAGHVALVGMSAGAAMAANLAAAYPERFAALALHSGLPVGAATDMTSALRAMRDTSGGGDVVAGAALRMMGSRARAIPVIALHGGADRIVAPANLRAVARQWRVVNGATPGTDLPVEEQLIPGLGHAWSGGAAGGSFTAPTAPDATKMIVEFFGRVGLFASR